MGGIINLDDYSLINKLYNIYNKFPNKIFFRLNPGIGNTNSIVKSNILGCPNAKFGISPENIIKCYKEKPSIELKKGESLVLKKYNGCPHFHDNSSVFLV